MINVMDYHIHWWRIWIAIALSLAIYMSHRMWEEGPFYREAWWWKSLEFLAVGFILSTFLILFIRLWEWAL